MRTQVAIIGAGPVGAAARRSCCAARASTASSSSGGRRDYVLARIRAGVLEQGTVDLLDEAGVGARLHARGAGA